MEWFLIPFIVLAGLGFACSALLGLFTFLEICFNLADMYFADWGHTWFVFKTALISLAIGCVSGLIFHALK